LILKGAEIPDGCVIGANSSVSKKLEKEYALYVGQPCRLSKSGISWRT
jgi:acetyltransferase-like isoleucine patch superfamily enzyme